MSLAQSQLYTSSDLQETLKPPGAIFSYKYLAYTLWSISRTPQKAFIKTSLWSSHWARLCKLEDAREKRPRHALHKLIQ